MTDHGLLALQIRWMKRWWTLRWRIHHLALGIRLALHRNRDEGYHRFIGKVCLCGQQMTDDPRRCEIWGPAGPVWG